MTLQEYILESLKGKIIKEAFNVEGYLDKQLDINKISAWIIQYGKKNKTIEKYVKNDMLWNSYLEQYKDIMAEPEIVALDNMAYKVLNKEAGKSSKYSSPDDLKDKDAALPPENNPKTTKQEENTNTNSSNSEDGVNYSEDGNFDNLDQKSKDIISGRMLIAMFVKFYAKIMKIVNENPLLNGLVASTDKETINNVALSTVKILFIYVSQNFKPIIDLDFLTNIDGKETADINQDLIRIILYIFIIEDMKEIGIDNKTIGELQNYMGIQ